MQTTTLPIQVSGPSANTAPRQATPGTSDAGQFSATLSRELALRKNAAAAPAPATPPQKPKAADQPPASNATPSAREPAQPVDASSEGKTESTASVDHEAEQEEQAAQAAEAAATPVADMLALVASFNQLQGVTPTGIPAATALRDMADGQLAGLQAGARGLGTEAGAEPLAAGLAALGGADPASPARAPAVGNDKAAARQDTSFSAVQDAASAAAATGGADAAGLNPRMTREAIESAALAEAPPLAALAQVQPAVLQAAQTAGAATDRLAARVGTPAWNQQVSQKIVWMIAGEEQTASLTLNPPDLGPMQVVLSVTNDQASVTFSSNQLEVRQALENALPRLREMMSENGIALGNATVDAGGADQRQAQDERSRGAAGRSRLGSGTEPGDASPLPAPRTRALGGLGMVDTFA